MEFTPRLLGVHYGDVTNASREELVSIPVRIFGLDVAHLAHLDTDTLRDMAMCLKGHKGKLKRKRDEDDDPDERPAQRRRIEEWEKLPRDVLFWIFEELPLRQLVELRAESPAFQYIVDVRIFGFLEYVPGDELIGVPLNLYGLFRRLKRLRVSPSPILGDTDLTKLISLTDLDVGHNDSISARGIEKLTQLRRLNVAHAPEDTPLVQLAGLSHLEVLFASENVEIEFDAAELYDWYDDEDVPSFPALRKLIAHDDVDILGRQLGPSTRVLPPTIELIHAGSIGRRLLGHLRENLQVLSLAGPPIAWATLPPLPHVHTLKIAAALDSSLLLSVDMAIALPAVTTLYTQGDVTGYNNVFPWWPNLTELRAVHNVMWNMNVAKLSGGALTALVTSRVNMKGTSQHPGLRVLRADFLGADIRTLSHLEHLQLAAYRLPSAERTNWVNPWPALISLVITELLSTATSSMEQYFETRTLRANAARVIASSTNLRALRVGGEWPDVIGAMPVIQLAQLTHLYLDRASQYQVKSMRWILRSATRLEGLVCSAFNVPEDGWAELPKSLRHLVINMRWDDVDIPVLHLPRLEVLTVRNCSGEQLRNVSDASLPVLRQITFTSADATNLLEFEAVLEHLTVFPVLRDVAIDFDIEDVFDGHPAEMKIIRRAFHWGIPTRREGLDEIYVLPTDPIYKDTLLSYEDVGAFAGMPLLTFPAPPDRDDPMDVSSTSMGLTQRLLSTDTPPIDSVDVMDVNATVLGLTLHARLLGVKFGTLENKTRAELLRMLAEQLQLPPASPDHVSDEQLRRMLRRLEEFSGGSLKRTREAGSPDPAPLDDDLELPDLPEDILFELYKNASFADLRNIAAAGSVGMAVARRVLAIRRAIYNPADVSESQWLMLKPLAMTAQRRYRGGVVELTTSDLDGFVEYLRTLHASHRPVRQQVYLAIMTILLRVRVLRFGNLASAGNLKVVTDRGIVLFADAIHVLVRMIVDAQVNHSLARIDALRTLELDATIFRQMMRIPLRVGQQHLAQDSVPTLIPNDYRHANRYITTERGLYLMKYDSMKAFYTTAVVVGNALHETMTVLARDMFSTRVVWMRSPFSENAHRPRRLSSPGTPTAPPWHPFDAINERGNPIFGAKTPFAEYSNMPISRFSGKLLKSYSAIGSDMRDTELLMFLRVFLRVQSRENLTPTRRVAHVNAIISALKVRSELVIPSTLVHQKAAEDVFDMLTPLAPTVAWTRVATIAQELFSNLTAITLRHDMIYGRSAAQMKRIIMKTVIWKRQGRHLSVTFVRNRPPSGVVQSSDKYINDTALLAAFLDILELVGNVRFVNMYGGFKILKPFITRIEKKLNKRVTADRYTVRFEDSTAADPVSSTTRRAELRNAFEGADAVVVYHNGVNLRDEDDVDDEDDTRAFKRRRQQQLLPSPSPSPQEKETDVMDVDRAVGLVTLGQPVRPDVITVRQWVRWTMVHPPLTLLHLANESPAFSEFLWRSDILRDRIDLAYGDKRYKHYRRIARRRGPDRKRRALAPPDLQILFAVSLIKWMDTVSSPYAIRHPASVSQRHHEIYYYLGNETQDLQIVLTFLPGDTERDWFRAALLSPEHTHTAVRLVRIAYDNTFPNVRTVADQRVHGYTQRVTLGARAVLPDTLVSRDVIVRLVAGLFAAQFTPLIAPVMHTQPQRSSTPTIVEEEEPVDDVRTRYGTMVLAGHVPPIGTAEGMQFERILKQHTVDEVSELIHMAPEGQLARYVRESNYWTRKFDALYPNDLLAIQHGLEPRYRDRVEWILPAYQRVQAMYVLIHHKQEDPAAAAVLEFSYVPADDTYFETNEMQIRLARKTAGAVRLLSLTIRYTRTPVPTLIAITDAESRRAERNRAAYEGVRSELVDIAKRVPVHDIIHTLIEYPPGHSMEMQYVMPGADPDPDVAFAFSHRFADRVLLPIFLRLYEGGFVSNTYFGHAEKA